MYQLEADHAEIRLGALLICDELFRRSHQFRELLVSEFQTFLEFTVETDPDQLLPPPVAIAKKLKSKALECIRQWNQTYGEGYKKLTLGYNFLQECKKIDFNNIHAQGAAERHLEEERVKRQEIVNQENLHRCLKEMEELVPEINSCLTQVEECLKLLAPDPLQIFSEVDFDDPQPCCSKSLGDDCVPKGVSDKIIDGEVPGNNVKSSPSGESDGECEEDMEETMNRDSIAEEEMAEEGDWMRHHGLGNTKYSLTVEIKPEILQLKVTSDNVPLMESLQEFHHVLSQKYVQSVSKWTQAIVKGSGPTEKLKKLIDLKNIIESVLKKCKKFGINGSKIPIVPNDDDEDDDEFEEVEPKDGFEPIIPQHLRHEYGLEPQPATSSKDRLVTSKEWKPAQVRHVVDELQDPASIIPNIKRLEATIIKKGLLTSASTQKSVQLTRNVENCTDATKAKLLPKAPKLRFDTDLLNWGEETFSASSSRILKLESLHRFWQPIHNDISEIANPEEAAAMRTRVIEFSGKFEQVKWQCRAPLSNGKLCPRQDRYKCPFHGPIIPRDNMGNPSNEEDRKRIQKQQEDEQRDNPEWQNPTFLKEIESATGINLTITKKKKSAMGRNKNKKRKYPGLTDLNDKQSTARTRLEKKVFDKSAVKRVAQTMDDLDYKKFKDKFGNQFNYSCVT